MGLAAQAMSRAGPAASVVGGGGIKVRGGSDSPTSITGTLLFNPLQRSCSSISVTLYSN